MGDLSLVSIKTQPWMTKDRDPLRIDGLRLIILLISSMLLLAGCSEGGSSQEVQHYVAEVMRRAPPKVEPVPPFVQYTPYRYSEQNERDPFSPPKPVVQNSALQPDLNRPKEELEAFPLDGLHMVGTLVQDKKVWALVLAPNQIVYRVTVGEHMGQNFGKVTAITAGKLDLSETVADGLGGWKQREVTLNLKDNGTTTP